jgi:hypothetical protein
LPGDSRQLIKDEPKANAQFKDAVIGDLFKDKERMAELCNSVKPGLNAKGSDMEDFTQSPSLFKNRRNDFVCVIRNIFFWFWARQSTSCGNIPARSSSAPGGCSSPAATPATGTPSILNYITKLRKFQRCSTLKPVEPATAIFEIFKNLMSFSIQRQDARFSRRRVHLPVQRERSDAGLQ